uniref:MT domain-containing protein n=1 Tax=Haemonchus contortus TaxID=6289 RepID=A0A7I4Z0W2_HAECO
MEVDSPVALDMDKDQELEALKRELELTRKELQSLKSRKEESMRSGVGTTVPDWAKKAARVEQLGVEQIQAILREDADEARLACLCAGLVEDPKKWCDVPRAMEFYNHLTKQLKEYGDYLESLKVPKSMKPGGPAHAVDKEGGPPTTDGRISERHLKRVEKRQERGYAA